MVIYKTLNTINGKYYIGMDTKNNSNYIGSGTLLKQAIKKYGKDSFKKIILEQCDSIDQLRDREKYWIEVYKACSDRDSYNVSTGGTGGDNFTHNPDRELIRAKLQTRRHTEATKNKISENNWQKYNPGSRTATQWSEEQRSKMVNYWKNNQGPMKGKTHTEEAIQANREKHKKPIVQFEKDGTFIKEWSSGKEAGESLRILRGSISSCLKQRLKTAGGFIWKYKEET